MVLLEEVKDVLDVLEMKRSFRGGKWAPKYLYSQLLL